jgi:hypothetical protein
LDVQEFLHELLAEGVLVSGADTRQELVQVLIHFLRLFFTRRLAINREDFEAA